MKDASRCPKQHRLLYSSPPSWTVHPLLGWWKLWTWPSCVSRNHLIYLHIAMCAYIEILLFRRVLAGKLSLLGSQILGRPSPKINTIELQIAPTKATSVELLASRNQFWAWHLQGDPGTRFQFRTSAVWRFWSTWYWHLKSSLLHRFGWL